MSSTPIIFHITQAGFQAAIDQQNNGLNLKLKKISFGTGHYASVDNDARTQLAQPLEEAFIAAAGTVPNTNNLILGVNFVPNSKVEVSEIGIITESGALFAVASLEEGEFFTLNPQVALVSSFGLALGTTSNISIEVQNDAPIVQQLLLNHESAANPHPQYASASEFDQHVTQNTLEHNNILTLITAAAQNADVNIQDAVDFLTSMIVQHKNAQNPHPQYLLANVFGVELLMTASENTPIEDKNRVFGWNGIDGDGLAFNKSPKWWVTHDETVTFKPFRAYGQFLLYFYQFKSEGDAKLTLSIFSKDDVLIDEQVILDLHTTHYDEQVKYLFYLNKGEYAKIRINGKVWNENWGAFRGTVLVDDRVKIFSPVGYQSSVELANTIEDGSQATENPIDYSVFSPAEWSWFNSDNEQYIALEDTTFTTPESHVPHYHRTLLTPNLELWISIEVGTQSVQSPNDYAAVSSKVVRGSTDSAGNIVVTIPLNMRSISIPEGAKAVYTVAYYDHEVTGLPSGELNGMHMFYAEPV